MQLSPVRQAELHSDLKIQEKDELQWKKMKVEGLDENGEKEAQLRRNFNGETWTMSSFSPVFTAESLAPKHSVTDPSNATLGWHCYDFYNMINVGLNYVNRNSWNSWNRKKYVKQPPRVFLLQDFPDTWFLYVCFNYWMLQNLNPFYSWNILQVVFMDMTKLRRWIKLKALASSTF